MNRRIDCAFAVIMLGAALAVAWLPARAYASDDVKVVLPAFKVELEGEAPLTAEEYQVVLKAEDGEYPMPEGCEDGKCTVNVTGEGTGTFPAITYSQVGVYTYSVCQIGGDNIQWKYDDTVYTVKVYIANEPEGQGLESEIVLTASGKDGKPEEIAFCNSYLSTKPIETQPQGKPSDITPQYSPTGPKTGDSADVWPYVCLAAVSAGMMALAASGKRRIS